MDVLQAVGALNQGVKLVKQLIPNRISSAQQSQNGAKPQSFGDILLNQQDLDGDGALSLKEAGISKDLFGRLDKDGDGFLNLEEINAGSRAIQRALQAELQAGEFMESHDANHDTLVSERESGLDSIRFEHIDQNNNATLTYEELVTAINNRTVDLST